MLYEDGTRQLATTTDTQDVYVWESQVDAYDTGGDLFSRTITYDDGREVVTLFQDSMFIA